MQKIGDIVTQTLATFEHVEGECPTHGPATVITRKGGQWNCPKCLEEKIAAEARTQWAEDRKTLLNQIARIPAKYRGQRFVPHDEAQKTVRSIARQFRDFIVTEPRWAALVLSGEAGTGKTLLACEIAEALMNRLLRSVRYTTAAGMIGEIRASYGQEGKTEDGEIERFAQFDLLIVDEVDAMRGTANDQMLLTEIINRRYSNERPVLVITNQKRDNLAQFVGDRIDDRLHENGFVCNFNWPSFRRKPAA
jgi:DNA replication protein DnaC